MVYRDRNIAIARADRWPAPGDRFNSAMLSTAREAVSYTQTDLAKAMGVSQALVGKWEADLACPNDEQVKAAAHELHVTEELFFVDRPMRLANESDFYHRALTKAKRKDLKAIHAKCSIWELQIDRLLGFAEPKEDRVPDINPDNHAGDIEQIAMRARTRMGIGSGPIPDIVSVIEDCGGIVIDRDVLADDVDALCRWVPGIPKLFFINGARPADRIRFSLAHELGHTIMHFGRDFNTKLAEEQANTFAAAFLMPACDIRRDLKPCMNLSDLAALKRKWRVSMQAIARRALTLNVIEETRYRSIYIQMSRKGWRKTEPVTMAGEPPKELNRLLQVHRDAGYSEEDLAKLFFVKDPDGVDDVVGGGGPATWTDNGIRLKLRR